MSNYLNFTNILLENRASLFFTTTYTSSGHDTQNHVSIRSPPHGAPYHGAERMYSSKPHVLNISITYQSPQLQRPSQANSTPPRKVRGSSRRPPCLRKRQYRRTASLATKEISRRRLTPARLAALCRAVGQTGGGDRRCCSQIPRRPTLPSRACRACYPDRSPGIPNWRE